MPTTGFPEWVVETLDSSLQSALRGSELKFEQSHISFGVIYDSAPSRDKLFNFRMTLGVDFVIDGNIDQLSLVSTGDPPTDSSVREYADVVLGNLLDTTGYGGTLKFTFGFSPIRTPLLKWWLGPCIHINGNYRNADIPIAPIPILLPQGAHLKHGGSVAIGGGIETGVNIHATSFMSVGLSFGFLWNAYGLGAGLEDRSGEISSGAIVWGDGPMFLLQVSALFHTGADRGAWQ